MAKRLERPCLAKPQGHSASRCDIWGDYDILYGILSIDLL